MKGDAPEESPPNWHPKRTYAWTRKQVQSWIDANGFKTFYDGALYEIEATHKVAGRYEVRFIPYDAG